MNFRLHCFVAYIAMCGPCAVAQQCSTSILATSPSTRFQTEEAVVFDRQFGLSWQRCSEGQRWTQANCHGEAMPFTWAEAQQIAVQRVGWRIPTLKELAGLVELSCAYPAINLQIFPNSPSEHYWSASNFATDPMMHWQVQFATGDSHNAKDTSVGVLRLVRESVNPSAHTSPKIQYPASVQ